MKNHKLKKQLKIQFYRGNLFYFGAAVLGSLLGGSLNLILSWLMRQLIDTASGIPGSLPLADLTWISVGFLFLCMIPFLLKYISVPGFIEKAMGQYKDFAFKKLMEKNISSFREEDTSAYLSSLSNDAVSIERNYLEQQFSLITKAAMFLGALAMMLWYSPLLTAIAVLLTILPLIASAFTGGMLAATERKVSDRNVDFTAALKDCLDGFTVVKSFKAEKEISGLFAEHNRSLEKEKYRRRRFGTMISMIGSVTGISAQLGVFVAGAYLSLTGHGITPGTVILFINLMNFVIDPVTQLPGLLAERRAAMGLIDKLAAELEKNVEPSGGREIEGIHSQISMEKVSFGYEAEKEVLHDLSFTFEAGRAYAVVGGSGSGKTTLLNLLASPGVDYTGRILLDGIPQKEIQSSSLYEMISVIQQNVFVFQSSIKANITMFRSFPEEEISEAVRRAHLKELIEEYGGDYLCGENGKGLSGGEKQRIAIARSLLKKTSVLLADEITSALDPGTSRQVMEDILDLEGILRIIVTHSLEEAILRRYDGILVLKDGRMEESGTFDELMEKKGYFYALYTVSQ